MTDGIVTPRPDRTAKVISVDPVDETKRAGLTKVRPDSRDVYAANVTDVRLQSIQSLLEDVLGEMKTMNRHLAVITDEDF